MADDVVEPTKEFSVTKNTLQTALVVLAALSSFVSPALATDTDKADKDTKSGRAVLIPASELQWKDVPGMRGVQTARVDGDPSRGPSHFFTKLAGGHAAPLHHHTADHFGTVVAGTLVLIVDGTEHKLPPGSYFAFTGQKKHATRCETGADCVFSTDARGKWDVVQDGDKPGGKK
jgi:quercetin dioxygenase-like cupin family protein